MSNQHPLEEQYADLLADQQDPTLQRVVQDLDTLAQVEPPAFLQERITLAILAQAREHSSHAINEQIQISPEIPSLVPLERKFPMSSFTTASPLKKSWKPLSILLATAATLLLMLISGGAGFAFARLNLDPTLSDQLSAPAAQMNYTPLNIPEQVGPTTINLAVAGINEKRLVVAYTYERPAIDANDTGSAGICPSAITSQEGDTFRKNIEGTQPGVIMSDSEPAKKEHRFSGSVVIYFLIDQFKGSQQNRHIQLTLQQCSGSTGAPVNINFIIKAQQ